MKGRLGGTRVRADESELDCELDDCDAVGQCQERWPKPLHLKQRSVVEEACEDDAASRIAAAAGAPANGWKKSPHRLHSRVLEDTLLPACETHGHNSAMLKAQIG